MTEHLPECFASLCECDDTHFKSIDCDFSCICPSLRACEQRVMESDEAWIKASTEANLQLYDEGRAAGLDAAQDAVAAISGHSTWPDMSYNDGLIDALAAIDALRERP